MSFFPAIQNFTSADTSGATITQCVLDWQNVYPYQQGSPYQITRFNFATGAEISSSNMPGTTSNGSCIIDKFGFLYARHSLANYNGISQANAATYVLTGSFGTDSSFNNLPNSIPAPGPITTIAVGSNIWLISICSIPLGTDAHSISAVLVGNVTPSFGGHLFEMSGGAWSVCAGPQSGLSATAYTVAGPSGLVSIPNAVELYKTVVLPQASSYSPVLWPTANPFITSSLVGSVMPTDVDPAWIGDIAQTGICYDATDGNVLIVVHTTAAVATTDYVLKLRTSDGTIMWRVPLPHGTTNSSFQMPLSRIRHGTFAMTIFYSSTIKSLIVINTITGSYTTTSVGMSGLFVQAQCYDDTTGALVVYTDYTAGANAPTQLGSTPSSFTGWAALYVQPVYSPPPRVKTRTWQTTYLP